MTDSEDVFLYNSPPTPAVLRLEMPGGGLRGNGYFIPIAAVRRIENKNNWIESKKPAWKTLKS